MTDQSPRFPLLNFLELEAMAQCLQSALGGARVDRVFVPALPEHPVGYFKQEWCIEFYTHQKIVQLFFCLRSQACSISFLPSKVLKSAGQATRSGFDLGLVKHLGGLKFSSAEAIPNERILILKFGPTDHQKSLLLYFIPAHPEAILIESSKNTGHHLLNRTRESSEFNYPVGRELTREFKQKFSINPIYGQNLTDYSQLYLNARKNSALWIRHLRIEKQLNEKKAYWSKKKESFENQVTHSKEEPPWSYYGALFQSSFYTKPQLINGTFALTDPDQNETVLVPGDPKLSPKQQLDYYFHQAKKSKTRLLESAHRIETAHQKLIEVNGALEQLRATPFHIDLLQKLESAWGLTAAPSLRTKSAARSTAEFTGKQVFSAEGLCLLAGRNQAENLELTFKIAKGNDLWLHLRGRPGSHVVIVLPPKKSASLETLLDAAHLCIQYSGGKDWGKAEVDYTYRKFVKKIKGQTEVSYSHNKTLSVTLEPERLKRLLNDSER